MRKSSFFLLFLVGILISLQTFAQQIAVKGVIKDTSGEPIIGASVIVKGTAKGTITDFEGRFTLETAKNALLKVSFVGYEPREIKASSSLLTITLKENTELLDEVVVVGYGTMKKSDLTGAVSSVDADKVASTPVASIGEAMQGRAAGVQIINSGKPGDNVTMKIRGLGTINDSNPLIVIDGVPTDLGLNALNVNDIETVDVLKDASATAIYGARGANGVVMITTKRGKEGKGTFSLSANYAIQQATGMPKLLNAAQYAALSNEMLQQAGMNVNPAWKDPQKLGKGTNWMNLLIGDAPMQNYSLSYSGGSKNANYYVSGSVFDQEGLVRNNNYRRYTFQFNGEENVKPWVKLSHQLTFSHDVKKQGEYDIMATMRALPTQKVYQEDGTWSGPTGAVEWYGGIRNPIGTTELNTTETKGYNFLGNIAAEFKLCKGLTFKTLGSIDFKSWQTESFTPAYNWKPVAVEESVKYQSSDQSITFLWDNYFTYDATFGKHKINAMAGMSAQNNTYKFMNGAKDSFLRDANNQLSNGLNVQSLSGNKSEWALLSYIARVNYSYADKYLLTATVRRDGSSRFGTGHKWGTFPSFSAAWRMSEETWFKSNPWIDDVKWRIGYGRTGNQNIGNYDFAAIYDLGTYNFNAHPVSTLVANRMPNPFIQWETVEQINLGVDFSLFSQRVRISADAYLKRTKDMLVPMAVPISTGYSDIDVPKINAGEMENKGIEVSINTSNIKGAFTWDTSLNLTFNKNKIVDLNSDAPMYANSIENSNITIQAEGHPMNSFYGYVTNGLFQTQEEVDNAALQVVGGTAPGDIRFKDLDNNGVINDNDRTFIGNPNPDLIYAMNNAFSWKGFDLNIFLQGSIGNDIYNANRLTLEGMKISENQNVAVLQRWNGAGTSNTMPRAVYNDPNKNTRGSDRYVEDGSYLRIKNISLGYTFKQPFVKRYVEQLRVYFSCQNVATITGYSGVDPEVGINGIDYGAYPLTRTFSVGCNIKF
jgi:TonB-linked SusC/RagA family outer membrane protein